MKEQTKNVLTIDYVEKELQFYNRADIRSTLILGLVVAVFFVPFTILGVCLVFVALDTLFWEILLSLILGALISCPLWLHIIAFAKHLTEKKLLIKGEFKIVCRKVTNKSEKIVHRHTEKFLSFEGFRDIPVDGTTYDLTAYGDAFYLVHYQGKNEIKLLYPEKMYNLKES